VGNLALSSIRSRPALMTLVPSIKRALAVLTSDAGVQATALGAVRTLSGEPAGRPLLLDCVGLAQVRCCCRRWDSYCRL
jgi:hypothetical protein